MAAGNCLQFPGIDSTDQIDSIIKVGGDVQDTSKLPIIETANFKEIGRGFSSISYLVTNLKFIGEITKEQVPKLVLRRQKIYPEDIANFGPDCGLTIYWEIDFYQFVNSLKLEQQKHFCKLFKYEFTRCDNFPIVYKISKSNVVLDQYIEYKEFGAIDEFKDNFESFYANRKQFIKEALNIFAIINESGYYYSDGHLSNFRYDVDPVTNVRTYSLIDYGRIYNEKYKMSVKNKAVMDHIIKFNMQMRIFVLKSILLIDTQTMGFKSNEDFYLKIVAYLREHDKKMLFEIKTYIEDKFKVNFYDELKKKPNYLNNRDYSVYVDIVIYFGIHNKEKLCALAGCKFIPNLMDKKDILKLL